MIHTLYVCVIVWWQSSQHLRGKQIFEMTIRLRSAVPCRAVQCRAVQDVWHTSLIHEGHYYQYQHDLSNSLKDVGTSYSIAVLTSKTKVPRAHQSTPLPCPLFSRISGARYSGVPQNVFVPPSAPDPKQWDQKEWISIVRSGDKSSGQESTGQESSGEERRGEERRGEGRRVQ